MAMARNPEFKRTSQARPCKAPSSNTVELSDEHGGVLRPDEIRAAPEKTHQMTSMCLARVGLCLFKGSICSGKVASREVMSTSPGVFRNGLGDARKWQNMAALCSSQCKLAGTPSNDQSCRPAESGASLADQQGCAEFRAVL